MRPSHAQFLKTIFSYYQQHGRHDLPWRQTAPNGSFDPYKVLLSEVMLQQTQVPRVIPKFAAFLQQFPDVSALAQASLGDVLVAWQGLGYNRRAKYLWQAAQMVVSEYGGIFPRTVEELIRLPGIGTNTAGAIVAYAYNEPTVFIETNIRTVYIHHYFHDQTGVPDAAIRELVERTIDRDNPRIFYWSLMDYGTHLKQTVGNLSRASKAYAKQSKFSGSLRQLRGRVLRLLAGGPLPAERLLYELSDPRAAQVLHDLEQEHMLRRQDGEYRLPR